MLWLNGNEGKYSGEPVNVSSLGVCGENAVPHVEFDAVDKSYDGRNLVVRGLDLAVERGEFLTLLGPSGSGKTTCLMMLAGFEAPTAGTIRIGGRPVLMDEPLGGLDRRLREEMQYEIRRIHSTLGVTVV